MRLFRISNLALMFFMLLISAAGAFAQQGNGPPPPPPGAGLCTDGQSLFVMTGDTLYQYSAADLVLVTTVALPKLAPPTDSDNQTQTSKFMARWAEKVKSIRSQVSSKISSDVSGDNQTQPPPPQQGSGLCTDGTYLFMLRGHSLQQYTVADMTLVKSVDLPKPEPPPTAD